MLIGYPQPGKAKSWRILEAFAAGCEGKVRQTAASVLEPGAAAFFGVVGIEHLLRLAIAEGREFYYGDNAFFDCARGRYFRFARNAVQLCRRAPPAPDRLRALGVTVRPWRKDGRHIVVVEQSEHFLDLVGFRYWLPAVLKALGEYTDRPVRVRRWDRDKGNAGKSLQADLQGAWALVTHMSAAANEALLAGVPVFVSELCAAAPLASGQLADIERPLYPDGRDEWAAGLADQQWTLDELRDGTAWRTLQS